MELVANGAAGGHKILLFSQFASMLALIRERLETVGIGSYLLTGDTPKEERLRMVDSFQKDGTPVFLISLKAGGTGLNLTAADMVIHYDPWWNVAAQNQGSQDRTGKAGQRVPAYHEEHDRREHPYTSAGQKPAGRSGHRRRAGWTDEGRRFMAIAFGRKNGYNNA